MLTIASMQNMAGGSKTLLAAMRKVLDTHNATVEQFENDKTRSREYVQEQITAARVAAMPRMVKDLETMRETAANAEAQREYWGSHALLMSRIPFHADPATDAALRMRYTTELAAMDTPLLELTMKNALDEKNLALAWACQMAARTRSESKLADLSEVEIPGQAQALQLIADCDAAYAEAELIVAAISGQGMSAVQKLQVGYRMNPNRPTKHNSAGRPVSA
jgi:hypothetical protein